MAEPSMIRIPAGRFVMGCIEGDRFANAHELPRVACEVAAFEMSLHPMAEDRSDLPRVNVTWDEALGLCQSLGVGYRLPTEIEWEYACRAGTSTPYPTGNQPDPRHVNFLYDEFGNRIGPGKRLPKGWGQPNAFGLHDMLGNVCEWVADSWRPSHASAWEESDLKVIRGGAWDYLPRLLRPSWRDFAARTTRRDNLGFRVARDLPT